MFGPRTAEGKTKTETMRCLKRYIALEVFSAPAHSRARRSSCSRGISGVVAGARLRPKPLGGRMTL